MNASIRGIMFVKADRIDERIDLCAKKFLNRYEDNLNKENFNGTRQTKRQGNASNN